MEIGAVKNIFVPADEAFGQRSNENILRVARHRFPADRELRFCTKLCVEFGKAGEQVMRIMEFNEHEVTLDGNHELAGWDLTFALRLDAIVRPVSYDSP